MSFYEYLAALVGLATLVCSVAVACHAATFPQVLPALQELWKTAMLAGGVAYTPAMVSKTKNVAGGQDGGMPGDSTQTTAEAKVSEGDGS